MICREETKREGDLVRAAALKAREEEAAQVCLNPDVVTCMACLAVNDIRLCYPQVSTARKKRVTRSGAGKGYPGQEEAGCRVDQRGERRPPSPQS